MAYLGFIGRFSVVAIVAATASVAHAQTPAPAPPSGPPFVLQSNGGDNLLQIDVLAQVDGRFALNDSGGAIANTFTVRRFRPILQGRLLRRFEFFFNPDFGGGTTVVQDAYFDTLFSSAFRVRIGKSKTPVGLERLILANSLVFVERSLATALVPNRDVGVQVLGDVAGNTFSYMASIGNGVTDGASADTDTNDEKEAAGRVIARPFARLAGSRLSGLGVGLAGSTGMVRELPVLRTATLLQPFLSYAGATANGDRVRVSPQAFYYHKAFAAFGEYVRSSQPIVRGAVGADVDHTAWEVTASYVLTGEVVTERAVRPRENFNFGGGAIGAIQIAARYHALEVDEAAVTLGLATPGSSRRAEGFTVGVNWYLNPFIKYVLNFERTVFDDDPDGPRPAENALVFRAQVFF